MLCEKSFQWVIFAVNLQNNLKPNAAGMDWVGRAIFLLKSIITFSRIQNVERAKKVWGAVAADFQSILPYK